MYQRGTLEEFEAWHEIAMEAENIPPEGKVGILNNEPAPDKQRTTVYSESIQHPLGGDDYIWLCGNYCNGDVYTDLEVKDLGWFE
jgi:hypothetical protein